MITPVIVQNKRINPIQTGENGRNELKNDSVKIIFIKPSILIATMLITLKASKVTLLGRFTDEIMLEVVILLSTLINRFVK